MTDITQVVEREDQAAATNIMSVIEKFASAPDFDIEKMKALLDMQERVMNRQAEQQFAQAMTEARSQMTRVTVVKRNDQTSSLYTPLPAIIDHIAPIYTSAGIDLVFSEGESPQSGYVRVLCDVLHAPTGHSIQRFIDIPIVTTGIKGNVNMTEIHARGSAFTYGRRYLTALLFNLSTGADDDGNAAGKAEEVISSEQVAEIQDFFDKDGDAEWEKAILEWIAGQYGVATLVELPKTKFSPVFSAVRAAFEKRRAAKEGVQ